MEDGDEDTSGAANLNKNGNSVNVTTENVEWKVTFSAEENFTSPSSKEVFPHRSNLESTELDVKEEDVSSESDESQTSDLHSDVNVQLSEDINSDNVIENVETKSVQYDESVDRRDHSVYFEEQSEVCSKDQENMLTILGGKSNLHSSSDEEIKCSKQDEGKKLVDHHSTHRKNEDEKDDREESPNISLNFSESNDNSDSEEEDFHKRLVGVSDSVNVAESNTKSEIIITDPLSYFDVKNENDEISSQKARGREKAESVNVNDSFLNESFSASSSVSQNSAKHSLSQQEKHDSSFEEVSDMEVISENESANIMKQERFEESFPLVGGKRCKLEESRLLITNLKNDVEEMEASDIINVDDDSTPVVQDVGLQMKVEGTVEQMEVDSTEWEKPKNEFEVTQDFAVDECDSSENEQNEVCEADNVSVCINEGTQIKENKELYEVEREQIKEVGDNSHEEGICEVVDTKTIEAVNEGISEELGLEISKDADKSMTKYMRKEMSEEDKSISEEEEEEDEDKSISEDADKSMSEEEDKSTSDEVDKSTSEEVDKSTSEEADKSTSEEADRSTSEEVDKSTSEADNSTSEEADKSMCEETAKATTEKVDKSMSEEAGQLVNKEVDKSESDEADQSSSEEVDKSMSEEGYKSIKEAINKEMDEEVGEDISEAMEKEISESVNKGISEEMDKDVSEGEDQKMSEEEDQKMSEEEDQKMSEEEDQKMSEDEDQKMSEEEDQKMSEEEDQKTSEEVNMNRSEGMNEEMGEVLSEEMEQEMNGIGDAETREEVDKERSERVVKVVKEKMDEDLQEEVDREMSEEEYREMSEEEGGKMSEEEVREMSEEEFREMSEDEDRDMSEEDDSKMSEEEDREMIVEEDKEMSEEEGTEMREEADKKISEEFSMEISEQMDKGMSEEEDGVVEMEVVKGEDRGKSNLEKVGSDMYVEMDKEVNVGALRQEEQSSNTSYKQLIELPVQEVISNSEKYIHTSHEETTKEIVPTVLDNESTPVEQMSSSQEIEDDTQVNKNRYKKHTKICNKSISDSSVKVNGEVDLMQRNYDDYESSSSVKEKVALKRKLPASPLQEISIGSAVHESCKTNECFKGFKKRYIAQVSETIANEIDESASMTEESHMKTARSIKKLVTEQAHLIVSHQQLTDREQTETPLTEYAQYLGLQPTVKFKCYNCSESGFPSMMKLQEHQSTCLKNINAQNLSKPAPTPIVEPIPSTNFRITRKVYLCSACGTYYENWNLFLHMREVHKRHICLFCLLMFSQADKLAGHLTAKHGITDDEFSSPEEFLNEYDGSFFVMCCTCEQMFSERDNFFDHACGNFIESSADQACSLCGLKGAHFPTCRRAFTDSSAVSSSPSQNSLNSNVCNSDTSPSSQSTNQDKLPKYSGALEKSSGRKSHQKQTDKINSSDKNRNRPANEYDYDISDAASYCHVNIDEPDKQKNSQLTVKDDIIDETMNESVSKETIDCADEIVKQDSDISSIETSKYPAEDVGRNDSINEPSNTTSQPETETSAEKDLSQSSENSEMVCNDVMFSDDPKSPPKVSSDSKDFQEPQTTEAGSAYPETVSLKLSKSHKGRVSESDSSVSAGDTRGSDDSSSSSDASSDENEIESKGPTETVKVAASEESDVDRSDSDKMSIVVDEPKSDGGDADKPENDNGCGNAYANDVDDVNDVNDVNDAGYSENNIESDVKMSEDKSVASNNDFGEEPQDIIQIAGDDVPLLELTLEETIDSLSIQSLVKECVKISCSTCVYCNHAKKIAVNGKQLVLHLLAEHRFEPVVCSDSGELTPIHGFVDNLKGKLADLQDMYFNTDSYDSVNKSFTKPYDRTYECFHCHFITTLHKELYVHNRKMHQKTILLCIMCKSNFYSYSELLCHLCPGIYVPDSNISFRCCLCVVDGLPSAFRLMVHLRKRHHACDVCLETTGDQQKLSNHVWKHKLHHLCYRCGIAYRNKPDITKHLFWKHGTESVLCKKCLQKKWPHVYHFCIPPNAFLCEECNASFSRAVALKVHKRLHVGDMAYECDECQEKFISKKLLRRHKDKHKQEVDDENKIASQGKEYELDDIKPVSEYVENEETNIKQIVDEPKEGEMQSLVESTSNTVNNAKRTENSEDIQNQQPDLATNKSEETTNKKSKVVDVYDLPPLNLSSDSDDSEDDFANKKLPEGVESTDQKAISSQCSTELTLPKVSQEGETQAEEETQPVEIVDGVWDNFKNYKANLEKRESLQAQVGGSLKTTESSASNHSNDFDNHTMMDIILADHDYCIVPEKPKEEESHPVVDLDQPESLQKSTGMDQESEENPDDKGDTFGADHNYCFNTSPSQEEKKESSETTVQNPSSLCPQTPPLPNQVNSVVPVSTPSSSPKKKQKSPKKKQKQSGSSSSSDSSSNSDSSSCTCGTNCSCSSTSSSSSGSSSSSSDSDSSSSEGRRRQAARRERRRERSKRKLDAESRGGTPPVTEPVSAVESQGSILTHGVTPAQIDSSGGGVLQVDDGPVAVVPEHEDNEFMIRESDLDTTETETDEDFYDKYPQRQANKLLAEKRNQLLLLAAVAPVNNGTLTQSSSPPTAPPVEPPEPMQKKKGKTKRHRKTPHNVSGKKVESKLKLNIPVSYYSNPSFPVTNPTLISPVINSQNVATSHPSRVSLNTFSPTPEASSTPCAYHSTGSGSETESKRLSKRKRIPKKFYGDSSDEEAENAPQQPYKWRKIAPNNNSNPPPPAPSPSVSNMFSFRNVSVNIPAPEPVQPSIPRAKSDDEGEDSESGQEAKRSSSDSSNSDSDNEHSDGDSDVETPANVTNMLPSASGNMNQQKNENLYCYCQCPYDEVSEMIACDGKDCSIEWFHFECVGIMVPPKGKWFCPDCRKKTTARSEYLLHA